MKLQDRLANYRLAFIFAGQGLAHLVRTQPNARVHALLTVAAVGLALWLSISTTEWAILILTTGLVWTAEAFNTALEAVVDLASPEINPLAKIAKDVSAGAVLITAIAAVAVAAFLFLPPLFELF